MEPAGPLTAEPTGSGVPPTPLSQDPQEPPAATRCEDPPGPYVIPACAAPAAGEGMRRSQGPHDSDSVGRSIPAPRKAATRARCKAADPRSLHRTLWQCFTSELGQTLGTNLGDKPPEVMTGILNLYQGKKDPGPSLQHLAIRSCFPGRWSGSGAGFSQDGESLEGIGALLVVLTTGCSAITSLPTAHVRTHDPAAPASHACPLNTHEGGIL